MKNLIVTFIIFSITTFSCQKEKKFGFVDRSKAINEYQEKMDVEEKYKPLNEAFIKRRDSMIQAFQFEYREAAIKAQRMSPQKQQELSQEFQQRDQLLTQQIQVEQRNLENSFNAEIDSSIVHFKKYVEQYGKDKGFFVIFGTSEATNTIMYGQDTIDVTEEIISGLNESYKKEETPTEKK